MTKTFEHSNAICDQCETVSHCSKHGCIPVRAEEPKRQLHEPVTEAETVAAIDAYGRYNGLAADGMKSALESFLQGRAKPAQEEITDAERYKELLYAVGNKYPGESRHETALRYIRRAESNTSGPVCASKGEKT